MSEQIIKWHDKEYIFEWTEDYINITELCDDVDCTDEIETYDYVRKL
jgi:hypothetical protein